MRRRTEILRIKVGELYEQFHGQDQARWDKLKNALTAALSSVSGVEAGARNEIRELFLTLWDKTSGRCNNLWNEVQLELQTMGIIY